jgi:putative membrane protein insertion efficiency factor
MAWLLIQFVRFYRLTLGQLYQGQCCFHPTCSQYAIDALQRHGAIRGSGKIIWRLLRCNRMVTRELQHDPA